LNLIQIFGSNEMNVMSAVALSASFSSKALLPTMQESPKHRKKISQIPENMPNYIIGSNSKS
jgi:hypothetical protein